MRRLAPQASFVMLMSVGVPFVYAVILQTRPGSDSGATDVLRTTLPAVLLAMPAWYAARAIAGSRQRLGLIAHAAAATTYGVLWAGAMYSGLGVWSDDRTWGDFARYSLPWAVFSGALLYGIIAGAAHSSVAEERLREQRAAALRAESATAKAQLEALRARFDPHFLFNALHSLTILVPEDPGRAAKGLDSLARLLRYAMNARRGPTHDVAVEDELAFITDYLALERLRLGDRLEVQLEVDDEALECAVPAFVLQPLVENAVRHAVAARPEGGVVRIAAHVDGGTLVLEVTDTGPGFAVDTPRAPAGIGLELVRELLRIRYGSRARCLIQSDVLNGTAARLELPAASEPARARRRPPVPGADEDGQPDANAPTRRVGSR